jgi:hypothetical protein
MSLNIDRSLTVSESRLTLSASVHSIKNNVKGRVFIVVSLQFNLCIVLLQFISLFPSPFP